MEFDLDDVLLCSEGLSTSPVLEYGGSSSTMSSSCGLHYITSSRFIETTDHPPAAITRGFESYAVHDDDVLVMEVEDDAITLTVLLEQELRLSNSLPHTAAAYLPKLRRNHQLCARRSIAVRWILEACNIFHFCPLTAALAVNYLDRYLALNIDLSTSTWMPWMLELLSVACLSIAAKMEEVDVPALNDLQAHRLEHSFQGAIIQRMELAVMEALEWKLRAVTAVTFAEMAVKALSDVVVDDDRRRDILMARQIPAGVLYMQLMDRSTELILGSLPEVEFLGFPASAVALAAVQCALEENFPMKAEAGLADFLLKFIPIHPDDAAKCRRKMEELVVDPVALHVLPGDLSKSGSSFCMGGHHKVLQQQQIIADPEGRNSSTSSSSTGVSSCCTSPTGVLQLHSIINTTFSHSLTSHSLTSTDYHHHHYNDNHAANASIFAASSLITVPAASSSGTTSFRRQVIHSISAGTPSSSVVHDDADPAAADSHDVLNTINDAAGFFTVFPVPRITIGDHEQQQLRLPRSKHSHIITAAAADHRLPSVEMTDLDEEPNPHAVKRQCRSIDRYEG